MPAPCSEAFVQKDYIVRKWAGVAIFNDKFDEKPRLPGAEADITSMAEALRLFGCELTCHRNQPGDQMMDVLRQSLEQESLEGQDALLCLLWSHGGYAQHAVTAPYSFSSVCCHVQAR